MLYLRILFGSFILLVVLTVYSSGYISEEKDTSNDNTNSASSDLVPKSNEDIIKNIETLENLGKVALKIQQGELAIEDTKIFYEEMVQILGDLTESVKDINNAYIFLNAEGIDRVIAPNFFIPNEKIKTDLLILMKCLFQATPTTASVMSEDIVDSLLDTFDNDANLALKAHALDVLYLWLPKNPQIQVRVMKLKGLEPFYNQVSKLDVSVVQNLLDLFNIILKEHLSARNEKIQRTKADLDRLRLYQRIGLLERMSTPTVCNGLLDIFEVAWNFNKSDILITVFDIVGNIKPFCVSIYSGNTKAIEVFDALLKYVQNEINIEYILGQGINVTNLDIVIQEYVNKIKIPAKRDEF